MTRTEKVLKNAGVEYSRDVDIAGFSTIGIHSVARYFATPNTIEQLCTLLRDLYAADIPHRVIGGMSNILPRADVYDGVLVNTRKLAGKRVAENEIYVECGARLSSVVKELRLKGLGGMAQLYHIPGTLGGSVRGNAGAHGLEISDVFVSANVYFPDVDEILFLQKNDMDFDYRTSRVRISGGVVLSSVLYARNVDPRQTDSDIEKFRLLRKNQPQGVRTLGSTFKRADGVSAGYYIDKCGLKGYSIGGAVVSDIHAGFILNRGGATSSDVISLIDQIKSRVYSRFGILLEEEIDYL